MSVLNNKFLKVDPRVILTPVIEPVIIALDSIFEEENVMATVTSGLRYPEGQLKIIRDYLRNRKLDSKYPEAMMGRVDDKFNWNGQEIYRWQLGWSALLNAKIIISPPIRAICLLDYISPSGVNRKGQYLNASIHFNGTAFDIGGGADGIEGNVNNELRVLKKAKERKIEGLISFLSERNNNCLHVDCIKVKIIPKP